MLIITKTVAVIIIMIVMKKKYHSHAEILNQLSGVDKFYYYGMGMGLRNELTENHINFEKAKYFEIGEIIENLNL